MIVQKCVHVCAHVSVCVHVCVCYDWGRGLPEGTIHLVRLLRSFA